MFFIGIKVHTLVLLGRICRSKLAYRLVHLRSNSRRKDAERKLLFSVSFINKAFGNPNNLFTWSDLKFLKEEENRLRMVEIERNNGKANVYVPSRSEVVVV